MSSLSLTNIPSHYSTVLDSIRHGQDTRANVSLQHVDDHICVGDLGPLILVLVERRLLLGFPLNMILSETLVLSASRAPYILISSSPDMISKIFH